MQSYVRFYVIFALLFVWGNIFSSHCYARIWTDNRGKTIEAEFVKFDGEKVYLRLSSGKQGSIAITSLSEKDQEYVRLLPKTSESKSSSTSTEVVEAEGIGMTIDEAKKDAIQQRSEKGKENVTSVDGASLLAKTDTKSMSEKDGMLLFAKVLRDQNFPYSLMEATAKVTGEPEKQGDGTYKVSVDVTCTVNQEKYKQFRQAVEPILEKLAISKTREVIKANYAYKGVNCILSFPGHYLFDNRKKEDSVFVWINTTRNKELTNTGWNVYEVPLKYVIVLYAYGSILPRINIDLCRDSSVILSERIGGYKYWHRFHRVLFHNCISQCLYNTDRIPEYNSDEGVLKELIDQGNTSFGAIDILTEAKQPKQQNNLLFEQRDAWSCYLFAPFLCGRVGGDPDYYGSREEFYPAFVPSFFRHIQVSLSKEELESLKLVKVNIMSENHAMDELYEKLPELADFVIVP
jgi:hypothetical protein